MPKKISFDATVLEQLKKIPLGRLVTYKILAGAAGHPSAIRAVGNAVGRNKQAPKVPCHRVIRSDGSIGGYSGKGGIKTKISLLKREGIRIRRGKVENFLKLLYNLKAKNRSV